MDNFFLSHKIQNSTRDQRYTVVTRLSRCLWWSRWWIPGVRRSTVYWHWVGICLTWQERWITCRLIYHTQTWSSAKQCGNKIITEKSCKSKATVIRWVRRYTGCISNKMSLEVCMGWAWKLNSPNGPGWAQRPMGRAASKIMPEKIAYKASNPCEFSPSDQCN